MTNELRFLCDEMLVGLRIAGYDMAIANVAAVTAISLNWRAPRGASC
jgi:uncharacterized protein with PIN domain